MNLNEIHPLHQIQIHIQVEVLVQILPMMSLPVVIRMESARDADSGAQSDVSSLTSAEELPDVPTTDDDSDLNSDKEIVWVKSARGVWGM